MRSVRGSRKAWGRAFGKQVARAKQMGASRFVYVDVEVITKETEKAFLCRIDGEDVWLPKSQIADPDDYEEGDEQFELGITEFIANEKGIEPK
jgi:hypothetical protein